MFLRAGLVSLALLLASRLLGLLRESVQAAALGATGLADVAVLMLTLPDLLTGILAAGALSYVLLPLWARQQAPEQAVTQVRLLRWLLVAGVVSGAVLVLAPELVTAVLAPGLTDIGRATAHGALVWSAAAMPLALVAALWTTRLQHGRDFLGMYGANLVVNACIVGALLLVALSGSVSAPIGLVGGGLLLGMGFRLVWLRWRQRRVNEPPARPARDSVPPRVGAVGFPAASVWLWALASAGLPLLLPLLGRSLASTSGEGALTTFNYAWKLVELPLVLAIQLVAALAFPGIAAAFAAGDAAVGPARREQQVKALRDALVLAWVLACAAAAAIAGMAPALSQLLFGWGRMTPEAVAQVAAWGRIGAWSLLPQALLAVLLTLMASTGRLRGAVGAYLGALGLLLLLGGLSYAAGQLDGAGVMWTLNAALSAAAVALLVRERDFLRGVLVFRDLLPALLAAVILATLASSLPAPQRLPGLGLALGLALSVLLVAWGVSPGLRQALRR
ncbi:lipid II flippase MurJ [Hydrogenophaga sp.]|uniref:lipid II flippase MurJ n=1 Tax=Hydrogenophaga sp. TaxID=1904254 RepID=UPI0025BE4339|nr:lipid II flippase MurJ [Hydrogenophaga sp.]